LGLLCLANDAGWLQAGGHGDGKYVPTTPGQRLIKQRAFQFGGQFCIIWKTGRLEDWKDENNQSSILPAFQKSGWM
jgi:hypothetical protein